jgi:hypothetical protein
VVRQCTGVQARPLKVYSRGGGIVADKRVLRMALRLSRRYEREYQEYLEEVEAAHREGFRAQYCEHGTYQWVDWDPICGPCEDGWSMANGTDRRRRALDEARSRVEQVDKMGRVLTEAVDVLGRDVVDTDRVLARIVELMAV